MDFGERLKNLRVSKEMSQQELAIRVGVSELTVRNWEHNKKKPNMDAFIKIALTLKISTDALAGMPLGNDIYSSLMLSPAEQNLLKSYRCLDLYGQKTVDAVCSLESERVKTEKQAVKIYPTNAHSCCERFIPRYTTPAAAGMSVPLDGADFEMMLVDDSVPAQADFAVNIQGDSMYPFINDGDMVFVQKNADIKIGDIGIWCVDGAMYCKQYYIDEGKNLHLISANEKLRDTNIYVSAESGSAVKFYGKVLLSERIKLPNYFFAEMV